MKLYKGLITASLVLAYAGSVFGAVSAEEAKKLGTTLTAVGAEKAGNADGSIPAYTGGLATPPASFKKGSGVRPDPFADEKPLFSINAKNMEQYAKQLTEGTKTLMKKYPSYRIDVYKTHRTVALPQSVQDSSALNAVKAQTTNGGLAIKNAKAGIPFPIPKDGYEAMWNHLLHYQGEAYELTFNAWNIDASGRKSLSTDGLEIVEFPYYDKKNQSSDIFFAVKIFYLGPARRNGESVMVKDSINLVEKGRQAWQYLPGQRRVKLAPEIAFDTPNANTAGNTTYDDAYMFNGSMELFNFKLIGKKEMYVPYNTYKMIYQTDADALLMPKHGNPDHIRWEKHRVWEVEGTLKPGKRHIYSKRVFYIDEDSWTALASDQYDMRGQLYRAQFGAITQSYDANAVYTDCGLSHDFIAGNYSINGLPGPKGKLKYISPLPAREWSPDSLTGVGIR